MRLTNRTRQIAPSPITEAKGWLTQRASTRPLLDLSQAAPSYPTAPVIADRIREVADSIDGGAYAPPPGMASLREAFGAEIGVDASHILPTAGCNQAFCIVASALCEPGDEMIIPVPYYFNHFMWLELDGVRPVLCPTDPTTFVPDPATVADLITDRTRAILLVTPGNPTGATIPPETIGEIAAIAADRDVALILDETYRNFRESGAPPHTLFDDPSWTNHVVSLHSFSKDLAIPGYRVGAVVAGSPLLDEAAKILDCVAICAPRIGQEAATTGLLHAGEWRSEQVARIHAGLAHFRHVMAAEPGGYELATSGAFFGWIRHPHRDRSTSDVVKSLVLDHDVLVIPGTAFMPDDDGWLRFSFANLAIEEIDELGERLSRST